MNGKHMSVTLLFADKCVGDGGGREDKQRGLQCVVAIVQLQLNFTAGQMMQLETTVVPVRGHITTKKRRQPGKSRIVNIFVILPVVVLLADSDVFHNMLSVSYLHLSAVGLSLPPHAIHGVMECARSPQPQ